MEFWNDRVIEKSWEVLLELNERFDFILIGGWAVHLHVNNEFKSDQGRRYIGSRDVDLGFTIDSSWKPNEIKGKAIGISLRKIEELGYTKSRFGFEISFNSWC